MKIYLSIFIASAAAMFFSVFVMNSKAQTPKELSATWEKSHVSDKFPSNVRHKDLQKYLEKLKKLGLKIQQVGASYANREIYQIEWGRGKTKVFMWSQMHGDEPTATSGLIDMFAFLEKNKNLDWVKNLENSLTIRAVPMLNPDGAELYQRRNLQSIDINRDAQNLETPEGRLLKKLRDEFAPDIGFNLHNQQELTTVGNTPKQATISFLAVSGNAENKTYAGHERNKQIIAEMTNALNEFIPGHIGRYDDTYEPRAFGDMISAWGSPVILIETGALHGRDEMFLVKLNFIANLTALNSIANESHKRADAKVYENLPFNNSGELYNVIFRRANIINPTDQTEPFTADIAINRERRRDELPAPFFIREVGDLSVYKGLDEYDVSEFYLVPKNDSVKLGAAGDFLFYKKERKIDFAAKDLEKQFPPDAAFIGGKWTKPLPK